MDKKGLVSVIMTVYNSEIFLKEAIDSILNQTYKNIEFIIVNDGSIDNSLEIIKSKMNLDNRIILINQENKGLPTALNNGLKLSKGEYIARMDSDDVSYPNRIEQQVNYMQNNTEIGVLGTWAISVDCKGEIKKKLILPTEDKDLKSRLIFSGCFIHPSVMIRKEILIKNNILYDEQFRHSQDYDLWSRLSKVTKFSNLPEILLKYRVIENSITSLNEKKLMDKFFLLNKIFKRELLNLEISNDEKKDILHYIISDNRGAKEKLDYYETINYLIKILNQNKKIKYYEDESFKKYIYRKMGLLFIYQIKKLQLNWLFILFKKEFYMGVMVLIKQLKERLW